MKVKLKVLSLLSLVFISCFSTTAAAVTPGVSIQDGEDWSLPSWVTGWSPYGGVYLIWQQLARVLDNNPNYDVRWKEGSWGELRWNDIHTGDGVFNWTILDSRISEVAAAGKKYLIHFEAGSLGFVHDVPQWVKNLYPSTQTVSCIYGPCYKMWTTGMGDKFKDFVTAVATRYANDNRVTYGYAFYETNSLNWLGGVPSSQYTPYYKSVLDTWIAGWGTAKTICPAVNLAEVNLNTYCVSKGVQLRSGWGEMIYETKSRPWLGWYYDSNTGYMKSLGKPSNFYGAEEEERGPHRDFWKLDLLFILAKDFNWVMYNGPPYRLVSGQNFTDACGNVYSGDSYVPLRDYARKVVGYPVDKGPDAFVLLREMQEASAPNATIKNIEHWLYQRDGITGGLTTKTEVRTWSQTDTKAWHCGNCNCTEDMYRALNNLGYEARSTNHATGNDYIYFGVNDSFMNGGSNNVSIKVYYKDGGTATWRIEYDAADGNKYKSTQSVTNTNSGKWKTATFTINDAKFSNGQGSANGIDINRDGDYSDANEKDGLDFRIYNGGSQDITVGMVRVLRLDNPSADTTPNGDLNADEKVNITDIQLCVKVILGTETTPDIVQRAKEVALPLDKADIRIYRR